MKKDSTLEKQGSELCRSCGLCCIGAVCNVTLVSPEEDREFANLFKEELVEEENGQKCWVDQPCVAFKGNCSQYKIRPIDCRTYQCALLKKFLSGKTTFKNASKTVRLTLTTLEKTTAQYNAQHSQSLTRDEISPVMKTLKRKAEAGGQQKTFWLRFPDYMTFCWKSPKCCRGKLLE